ncbi:uncharacterized protein V1518DRAFT_425555 [Limtongia smithiae]|uniref:uncharacterized protein n=1 Tax=Limtongia smithiae TaxID=1125753 RepID=UPI0034CF31F0
MSPQNLNADTIPPLSRAPSYASTARSVATAALPPAYSDTTLPTQPPNAAASPYRAGQHERMSIALQDLTPAGGRLMYTTVHQQNGTTDPVTFDPELATLYDYSKPPKYPFPQNVRELMKTEKGMLQVLAFFFVISACLTALAIIPFLLKQ